MNNIKMWYARNFQIISNELAKEWNLKWYRNVFSDEINKQNCRSLWTDKNGCMYRVEMLIELEFYCYDETVQIAEETGDPIIKCKKQCYMCKK